MQSAKCKVGFAFYFALCTLHFALALNYFNYFSEIEETFVRRRGKNLLLSPLDWALIEAWKERGIPLHVVLRAIENIFDAADKQPARKRSIKSLVYCRDEVENLFAVWLDAQVGNPPPAKAAFAEKTAQTPPQSVAAQETPEAEIPSEIVFLHLRKIRDSLAQERLALSADWQIFSAELLRLLETAGSEFTETKNLENLEAELSQIDHRIDDRLSQTFDSQQLAKIKSETVAQLRSYESRMSREVYTETFNNLFVKNLRDSVGLYRFSLFYL